MRTLVRAALTVVLVLLGALAMPASAFADEAKSVQVVGQDGRILDLVVYLDPAFEPSGTATPTSKVVVSGQELPSEASLVASKGIEREAVLVLDVSGSMRGDRLTAAQQAATDYVNALPADVNVGLVLFNDAVASSVKPSADRAEVLAAISAAQAGQKTALYDGLVSAVALTDAAKDSRLLLLSDGGDTASTSTLDDVTASLAAQDVAVDVVALSPNLVHSAVLRTIADSTGGQYIFANDAAGLQVAFDEATGSFGGKVAITATAPEGLDASGKFAIVSVALDGTDFTGTVELPQSADLGGSGVAGVGEPSAPSGTSALPPMPTQASNAAPIIWGLLAALVVIMLALVWAYYRDQGRARARVRQVLWYSTAAEGRLVPGAAGPESLKSSFVLALDEWLATRKGYPAAEAKLDNARLSLTPGSWLLVRALVTAALVLVMLLLFGNFVVGLLVGVAVGWLGTRAFIDSRQTATRKDFETELPDFLMLIASALRSGLSFAQALDSSAAEGQGQVGRQIRRALREVQMGSGIEDALVRVADRMDSDDLRWTVTALAIQREVGGNLSNILDSAAQTVLGRAELRREVRTLSAEGRLSGWVLAALPVGLFFYMLLVNRPYVSFFWTDPAGRILVVVMLVVFALGFIWMRRLVRIKV